MRIVFDLVYASAHDPRKVSEPSSHRQRRGRKGRPNNASSLIQRNFGMTALATSIVSGLVFSAVLPVLMPIWIVK